VLLVVQRKLYFETDKNSQIKQPQILCTCGFYERCHTEPPCLKKALFILIKPFNTRTRVAFSEIVIYYFTNHYNRNNKKWILKMSSCVFSCILAMNIQFLFTRQLLFSGMEITVTHQWSLSIEVSLKKLKQIQANVT
jgi:hypothetical protein